MKKIKVTVLCKQFGVSTSDFYTWKKCQVRIVKQYENTSILRIQMIEYQQHQIC